MHRRDLLAAVTAGLAFAAAPAHAATEAAFTQAAFDDADKRGAPVVVHVSAVWCPICTKQKPIMAKLAADPAFAGLTILDVDFDAQKDVVREFDVQMQSTIIVFRGGKEAARSVGDTSEASIRALLTKAVA